MSQSILTQDQMMQFGWEMYSHWQPVGLALVGFFFTAMMAWEIVSLHEGGSVGGDYVGIIGRTVMAIVLLYNFPPLIENLKDFTHSIELSVTREGTIESATDRFNLLLTNNGEGWLNTTGAGVSGWFRTQFEIGMISVATAIKELVFFLYRIFGH